MMEHEKHHSRGKTKQIWEDEVMELWGKKRQNCFNVFLGQSFDSKVATLWEVVQSFKKFSNLKE